MASSSSQGRRTGKGAKKTGRRRQRAPGADYYVEHTDRDMLLLIPSELQDTVTVVKRVRRAEEPSPPITTDCGWGSVMPPEIIHRIFQQVVESDGAVPALCRLARVCRLWRQVASSPDLWQRVSVSRCWVVPSEKLPPNVLKKVKSTMEALIQHRLSQVCDFSLHHWIDLVPFVLQSLSSSCPLLASLTLSHCKKVTVDALLSLGDSCPGLTSLNLQDCQVQVNAVSRFLGVRGAGLRCLYLSFNFQTSSLISLLTSGSCPELRVLEVNRVVKNWNGDVFFSIEGLQKSCPKLEVLRLLNVYFSLKSKMSSSESPGFSYLHELCLATYYYSSFDDSACKRLLRDCTSLRVLDLRGCYKVTAEAICDLPCTDVERLYLGMYCSDGDRIYALPTTGCSLLARRWKHSLQELDLRGQIFTECELSETLEILSRDGCNDTLQSLNLRGTSVPASAIRDLLSSCPALIHLDLTSCRNIPRGLKCVYRGVEDMRRCLKTLSSKMVEESKE